MPHSAQERRAPAVNCSWWSLGFGCAAGVGVDEERVVLVAVVATLEDDIGVGRARLARGTKKPLRDVWRVAVERAVLVSIAAKGEGGAEGADATSMGVGVRMLLLPLPFVGEENSGDSSSSSSSSSDASTDCCRTRLRRAVVGEELGGGGVNTSDPTDDDANAREGGEEGGGGRRPYVRRTGGLYISDSRVEEPESKPRY